MKRSVLIPGINDLATTHPDLAQLWSSKNTKNPNDVLPGSPMKALWECPNGHVWENLIRQEATKIVHCKECVKDEPKLVINLDDIAKKYSVENKKEFSGNLPKTRMFLWDCPKCSSQYNQTLSNEMKGIGCPYCSHRKVKAGVNDIATLFPDLMKYWDKNNTTSITSHGKGSQIPVLWNCPTCQGRWETKPSVQIKKKSEAYCPYCSGNKMLIGVNDLATLFPEKANQFHTERNGSRSANDFQPSSYETVWWRNQECGHEWEQPIVNRVNSSTDCQVCSGAVIINGVNSLVDIKPYIKNYWDEDRNIVPQGKVSPNSSIPVYLKCEFNHSWSTLPGRITPNITCPICSNKQVLVGFNDLLTTHPELAEQWHPTLNLPLTPKDVTAGTHTRINWICKQGHEWATKGNDRVNYNTGCPECIPFNKSQAEDELASWIESLGLVVLRHKRKIIGSELDLYIPEKQIAIEYNGIYWHTEKHGKHKNYHYDKWLACKEKGIQLIQIWEDDWKRNSFLIKKMVAHKLGVSNQKRIFARQAKIAKLTQVQTNLFLDENHVQGAVDGSIRVGLTVDDSIVAAIVFKKEAGSQGKVLNLLRYATSMTVVGGFSRLLKHIESTYSPESIITFSDNTVSDGALYENSNFYAEAKLPPDYMYVVNNKRTHKFNYRLKRFRTDPNLEYIEGISERELADLNNIPRIWDAGKIRWVRKTNPEVKA